MKDYVIEELFKNKSLDKPVAIKYGFKLQKNKTYLYETNLIDNQFTLRVYASDKNNVSAELIENAFGEKYTLHLKPDISGNFIGIVKTEYRRILTLIAENCFVKEYFKNETAKKVSKYILKKYGDTPQFLWDKYPDFAVFRCSKNQKWYAIMMSIPANKIGLNSNEKVQVLNVCAEPEKIPNLIDNKKIFPVYHMNKKYWITILFDTGITLREIYLLINNSYKIISKR